MNYFLSYNLNAYAGKKEVIKFYDSLCKECINKFKKYYDNFPNNLKEHGFFSGEQQTKTFVTLALDKVTKGYFIQENPTGRKYFNEDNKKIETSYGRTDYWANYSNTTYLIEIKDAWIRFYPEENDFTFYNSIKKLLNHAIEQIDSVDNRQSFNYSKRMFGLGLIIAPIFYRVSRKREGKNLKLDNKTISLLENYAISSGANIFSFWRIPQEYLTDESVEKKNRVNVVGLAFLGKYKKITKG